MKFNYKISSNIFSLVMSYSNNSLLSRLQKNLIKINLLVFLTFFSLSSIFISRDFLYVLTTITIPFLICFCIFNIFLYISYNKLTILNYKRLYKSSSYPYEEFSVYIDNSNFVRSSSSQYLKFNLTELRSIKFSNEYLLLDFVSYRNIIIPVESLSITGNEFINNLKSKNNNIEIIDIDKSNNNATIYKKYNKKQTIISLVVLILLISTQLILCNYSNKSPYKDLNLITQDNLKEETSNDTYVYEDRNLNISISFPKSWNGNYGISSEDNALSVYYLKDGINDKHTNLLFKIVNVLDGHSMNGYFLIDHFNIRGNFYNMIAPKKISLFKDSAESEQYSNMRKDLNKLIIKGIN